MLTYQGNLGYSIENTFGNTVTISVSVGGGGNPGDCGSQGGNSVLGTVTAIGGGYGCGVGHGGASGPPGGSGGSGVVYDVHDTRAA